MNTKYDKPYKMLQTTVTEGVREVTWSRLSDKNYDEFVVSLYLTDDLVPGRMLYFPVVQSARRVCIAGSRFRKMANPPTCRNLRPD